MPATFASLISECERHLLAGEREQMNRLTSSVDTSQDTVTFDFALQGIQPGAYIAAGLEVFYVWAVDNGTRTATVERAQTGSPATAHAAGEVATINPKFSKWDIGTAINQEIRDLSAPPNGLFRVKNFTTTTQAVQVTYAIPEANDDLLAVLEVRYDPPGPEISWERITRWEMSVVRNQPTGARGSPSGISLRIDRPLYPGRTLNVTYAAPFTELVNFDDDVVAVTGLPESATDIPSLGAAARLMGAREAKRSFIEAATGHRRAGDVPSGSSARAGQVLMSLLNDRLSTELVRLRKQYPEMY